MDEYVDLKGLRENEYHAFMRILHTSDLHVGRSLHEYPLIDDQEYMLKSLGDLLIAGEYDVLVIAGDIYDRSIPPPEAVSLFSRFLGRINREVKGLTVLIISGNHDSQTRLSYGSEIFAEQDIHVRTDPERAWEPVSISAKGVKADFYLVPFLFPGAFSGSSDPVQPAIGELPFDSFSSRDDAEGLRSQEEMISYAIARARKVFRKGTLPVLCCHTFAKGGRSSDSERIFVGSAEQVDASLFNPFAYTALGHLHNPQKIADSAWYSGSPLSYSFSESEGDKCFLTVQLGKDSVDVERVPIKPVRRVKRIEASFGELKEGSVFNEFSQDYLEIVLTGREIVQNAYTLLKTKYPYLLSVRQKAFESAEVDIPAIAEGTESSILDDFRSFEIFLRGTDPDEAACDLFQGVLAEASLDETNQTGS